MLRKISGHGQIGGAEAAGDIQHTLAAEQTNHTAQPADADPAHKACLEAFFFNKAAADAHVIDAVQHRLHDLHQVGGVVLAIAVHLYGDIIAVAHGVQVAALHAAADAQIDGQIEKRIMTAFQQRSAAVGRAVVHDKKVHLRAGGAQVFHRIDDVILLIIAGDDHQNFFIQNGYTSQFWVCCILWGIEAVTARLRAAHVRPLQLCLTACRGRRPRRPAEGSKPLPTKPLENGLRGLPHFPSTVNSSSRFNNSALR